MYGSESMWQQKYNHRGRSPTDVACIMCSCSPAPNESWLFRSLFSGFISTEPSWKEYRSCTHTLRQLWNGDSAGREGQCSPLTHVHIVDNILYVFWTTQGHVLQIKKQLCVYKVTTKNYYIIIFVAALWLLHLCDTWDVKSAYYGLSCFSLPLLRGGGLSLLNISTF